MVPPPSNAPEPVDTPLDQIDSIYADIQQTFRKRTLLPLETRKRALAQLAHLIQENGQRVADAIFQDLHRPHRDSLLAEVNGTVGCCLAAINNLENWTEDIRSNDKGTMHEHWNARAVKTPKGPVLIIGPYNYPVFLSVGVLVAALAAGNPAVVKFSDIAPATGALMQELFPKYLDPKVAKLVIGGVPQTTKLLEKKWGHIFYTGNGTVGRIVATAAAQTLTPCTLELGGKSPTIIDPTFDLKLAARRILYGKIQTAGQICVGPDYILVPKEAQEGLIEGFKEAMAEFFPQGAQASDSYSRMLNNRHFKRVSTTLDGSKGKIVVGGAMDEQDKFIEPTVVADIANDDSLMQDEIFGPIIPIVTVKDIDEAIEYVNDRDTPLSLYLFTTNPEIKKKVEDLTLSGSFIINDTIAQIMIPDLPFSGVGESGYGMSYGKWAFDGFTHLRTTAEVPVEAEPFMGVRYPPYTVEKMEIIKKFAPPLKIPYPKEERDFGISL